MSNLRYFSDKCLCQIVPSLLGGCLLAVLILSFFVPIYTDEVGWKIVSSRFFLDEGRAISLFPQCSSTFLRPIPIWLLPARHLDGLLYGDLSSLLKLRLLGCFSFLLFIAMVIPFLKKLLKNEGKNSLASWIFYGVLAGLLFGVLPLKMVLNRPEPALLICLMSLLWLPLLRNQSQLRDHLLRGGYCALTLLLLSQHPKALFFCPFVILVGLFLSEKTITKAMLVGFCLVVTTLSISWSSTGTICPESKLVNQVNSNVMVNPRMFFEEPSQTIGRLGKNFFRFPEYIYQVIFGDVYPYEWLPPTKVYSPLKKVMNSLIKLYFYLVSFSVLLFSILNVWRKKKWWQSYPFLASVALTLGVVGINLFQNTRNFYESSLIIPLLILCFGILLTQTSGYPKNLVIYVKSFALFSLLFAAISVSVLMYYFYPSAKGAWYRGGYLANQNLSVSAIRTSEIRGRIEKLAAQCGIKNDPKWKHVVLDDLTYSFFGKTKEPFHALYIMGFWGTDITDKAQFLKDNQSSGLISTCRLLEPEILNLATKDGELCCVGRF